MATNHPAGTVPINSAVYRMSVDDLIDGGTPDQIRVAILALAGAYSGHPNKAHQVSFVAQGIHAVLTVHFPN
jgi:hypothetical protein